MIKPELGTPTYTPEDILNNIERNLEHQIADGEREKILLEGRIAALESTLANLKYMKNHRQ